MLSPTQRMWLSRAARALAIVVVLGGLYFFARGIDGHALLAALRDAAPVPLLCAAAASFLNMFWKALCWRALLGRKHPVPVLRLYRYTLAALAGSLIVPARAGEALRVWLLKRRDGVPITASASVVIAEKLVDGSAMVIFVSPLLWLMPGLPSWVGRSIGLLVIAAIAGVAALLIVHRRARPGSLLGKLAAGMMVLASPATLVFALGACLLAQLTDFSTVMLVLSAVGVKVSPSVGMLIILSVNVLILIPTTPANVGALEIGAVVALDMVGVPRPAAMAFAILYHAVQAIPLLIAGLLDIRLTLGMSREMAQEPPAAAADPEAA